MQRKPIPVTRAWEIIQEHVGVLGTEDVDCQHAVGRFAANDVRTDRDYPPFPRAAMDGYAVQSSETQGADQEHPVQLRVVGEITPGQVFPARQAPGTAVRIMTGGAVPEGWDSVIPVEQTGGFAGEVAKIFASTNPGQHISPRGIERRDSECVIQRGQSLHAASVGILAMVGMKQVSVFQRPRVSILATGQELVEPQGTPRAVEIRNSNSTMLAALAQPYCADIRDLGITSDQKKSIQQRIEQGLDADLLVITGGISMGTHDHVLEALEECGAKIHFAKVAMQPGKPVTFATKASVAVLALPGNPVSALTTFRLFAKSVLMRMQGGPVQPTEWIQGVSQFEWTRRHDKMVLLPGFHAAGQVDRVTYTGSGDLMAYSAANCQIVLPAERDVVREGDPVFFWPL